MHVEESGWLQVVLAKIYPTRIYEFVWSKKIGYEQKFRPNFKSEYYIFRISIVQTLFWPEFSLVQIGRPEKIEYRSSISCPNFDIIRFVRLEFEPNPNFASANYKNNIISVEPLNIVFTISFLEINIYFLF